MAKVEMFKCAVKSLGLDTNKVKTFIRQFDPKVGEELTHRITGQRFFRDPDFVGNGVTIFGSAREITKDGYRGISREQFEALKQHTLRTKELAYGNKSLVDSFTGAEYWYLNCTDGKHLGVMFDCHQGKTYLSTAEGEKIKKLLG